MKTNKAAHGATNPKDFGLSIDGHIKKPFGCWLHVHYITPRTEQKIIAFVTEKYKIALHFHE